MRYVRIFANKAKEFSLCSLNDISLLIVIRKPLLPLGIFEVLLVEGFVVFIPVHYHLGHSHGKAGSVWLTGGKVEARGGNGLQDDAVIGRVALHPHPF